MKFILLATLACYALATTFASNTVTITAAYTSGTKTNATCGLTIGVTGTIAAATATAGTAEYFGLWLSTTSAITTASASDYYITCNWQVATAATAQTLVTTFTTSPACTAYTSSGTAWVSNSTLTTSSSTITATGTLSTMAALGFVFVNATTSNFTKSSLSLYNWVAVNEGSAATWTGTSSTQTTIALSACTAGMAAITSSAL